MDSGHELLGASDAEADGTLLAAALAYARHGWRVLPLHSPRAAQCSCGRSDCKSAAKHPRTINGLKAATTDERQIRAWWRRWPDANIGLATGRGLLVADVDPRNGGDLSALGEIPVSAARVATGADGWHVYYAGTGKGGRLDGNAVEIKGEGGYVVAPPSQHISGRFYTFTREPDGALPPLPPGLCPRSARRAPPAGDQPIPAGQRHDGLVSYAGHLRNQGLGQAALAAVLLDHNRRCCQPPLPSDEVHRIARDSERWDRRAGPPAARDVTPPASTGRATGAATTLRESIPAWLRGKPMDPTRSSAEPIPTLAGFPFLHPGTAAVIVGPTGGGRSSLVQACLYDATCSGLRGLYLGSEVTESEFDARAGILAELRGEAVSDELLKRLAHVRYVNLASAVVEAWDAPESWVDGIVASYDVIVLDPLSAVASALDLDFDTSNADFVRYYDRLVQPLTAQGATVLMVDNVGHAHEARRRAKGASAKSDRADLTFSCAPVAAPVVGFVITAEKVRTVRAAFGRGDEWFFVRDTQRIERRSERGIADERHLEGFRPTRMMERVSKLIEAEPGITTMAVRRGVSGRNGLKDHALRALIDEGYVECRVHGQAHRHHHIRTFAADSEVCGAPDGAPTTAPDPPHRAPKDAPTAPPAPSTPAPPAPIDRAQGRGAGSGEGPTGDPNDNFTRRLSELTDSELVEAFPGSTFVPDAADADSADVITWDFPAGVTA